jgi:hypothetical protein
MPPDNRTGERQAMKRHAWAVALLLTLVAAARGRGGEPPDCVSSHPCCLSRLAPAGGWFPYGGGLLHWWTPHCFPHGGTPDDYCRKKLPEVCWPPYPFSYLFGTPDHHSPQDSGGPASNQPH